MFLVLSLKETGTRKIGSNQARGEEGVGVTTAKKEFRLKWAQKLLDTMVERTEKKDSWQEVSEEHGTYEPFACIVVANGYAYDQEGAIKRARNYCDKCLEMGGRWYELNTMTNEIEFFYLKKTFRTVMAEMWSLYQETKGNEQKVGKPETKGDGGVSTPRPAKKMKTGDGPETKKNLAEKDEASPSMKKSLDKQVALANKVKKEYHTAKSEATTLIDTIGSDKTWLWANNEQSRGQLVNGIAAMEKSLSDFGKTMLISNLAELRKVHAPTFMMAELEKFGQLTPFIEALKRKHGALVDMHLKHKEMSETD